MLNVVVSSFTTLFIKLATKSQENPEDTVDRSQGVHSTLQWRFKTTPTKLSAET